MSNNSIIEEALATALKEILKRQPLSKISVKLITNYCNISRNTFYYHFKDKYELINWIFYSDMLKNVNSFTDPTKLTESFVNVYKCLYNNRKFYLACFQYVGQNSLYQYLFDFYYELWLINIDMRCSEAGLKLTEDQLGLLAKLRCHSIVGLISDWVRDGMRDNYMTYFEQLHTVLELSNSVYSILYEQQLLKTVSCVLDDNSKEKKCVKVC